MATIRIGDLLLSKGLINDVQLKIALVQQKVTGDLLGDTLSRLGFVTSKELGQILAKQSGLEFIDLGGYSISDEALRLIPKDIAEKMEFMPLELHDGMLSIGVTNPSNIMAIDTVTRLTKKQPRVFMVDVDSFRDTVESAYFFLENPIQERVDAIIKEIKATESTTGTNVSSLADLIVMDGIRRKATDIHVNPTSNSVHVFYRIDGVLQHGHCLPKLSHAGMVSRVKIMSQLDIAEQRLPQDGSFTYNFLKKGFDIRVSSVPTIYGENLVMRILAGSGPLLRIENLGFDPGEAAGIRGLFKKPHGIILITGPTGSGKTTTLYAALREINLIERNVLTVEDPVEYKLSLIKQTQVNDKVGYDFALAGRNFMRQDPDVMLLGEIRDENTAKIAIRASITGHLVISTLHTNDAVTSIPRLLDLNADRFLLSSSLLAIMAQRLVRRICRHCKEEYELSAEEAALFREQGIEISRAYRGKGCQKCGGSGYSGRTVIGEIMKIDDEIRELIYSGASVIAIQENAVKKGMKPLKSDGLSKAAKGITTLDEVLRVAG